MHACSVLFECLQIIFVLFLVLEHTGIPSIAIPLQISSDGLRQEWTCVVFQPGKLTLGNSQCFTRSVEGYWQPMRERGLLWNTESDFWAVREPGAFLETHDSPLLSSYLMGMDLGIMRHYWKMKGADVKTSSEPLQNLWGKVNVIRHVWLTNLALFVSRMYELSYASHALFT